jgi:putative restriction endonuclease
VDPAERRVVVSNRIRQEFENGKEYYRLEGQMIREPRDLKMRPLSGNLEYHAYNVPQNLDSFCEAETETSSS